MGLFDSIAKVAAGNSKGYSKAGDPLGLFPDQDTAGIMPNRPGQTDIWRGSQGYLQDAYELKGQGANLPGLEGKLNNINLNTQGLEEIRKRALATGPSAWADIAGKQQALEEANLRDKAASGEAGARSEALSSLASKGGLSTGSRERLATSGARNYANSLQEIARGGAQSRLGISAQDESNKLNLLQQLPGMEVQSLQPEFQKTSLWADQSNRDRDYQTNVDKYNVDNRLGAVAAKDAANLSEYQEKMRTYAAAKSADALANSSKDKGGGKGGGK